MTSCSGVGSFSAGVTLYSYVGGSELPITARQEFGGVTAPTIQLSQNVFAFSRNVLTSPYATAPPPKNFPNKPDI
jgi:hypothetical protein